MTNELFNCDTCKSSKKGVCADDFSHFYGEKCSDIKNDPNLDNDICIYYAVSERKLTKKHKELGNI